MARVTREQVVRCRNVTARIIRRLSQLEPDMTLLYSPTDANYQLHGAAPAPITFEMDELLGLWRFLGTSKHSYDEALIMWRGGRLKDRSDGTIYYEKPLSKHKHFHWISKLEACAREKLDAARPAVFDYRGLLDDTKPQHDLAAQVAALGADSLLPGWKPAGPQGATGEPAELPEPDEDIPDFSSGPAELSSV